MTLRPQEPAASSFRSATPAPAPSHGLAHPRAWLIDGVTGQAWYGDALRERLAANAELLGDMPPGLLLLPASWTIEIVCLYLAALQQRRPVALLDPAIDVDALHELAARYAPAALWLPGTTLAPPAGYRPASWGWRNVAPAARVRPELALLLSTSGSTGIPRLVRLSRSAVLANAAAIAHALDINGHDVAITSMPFHLGYGLSVLHSHLFAGASVVLTTEPVLSTEFWQIVDQQGVTSFASVAPLFDCLMRLRWSPAAHPSLHTLTQSGSRMDPALLATLHQETTRAGARLYLMYGQTEATARLAVLPPSRLRSKPGSVGLAISGGKFSILDAQGEETREPNLVGEVLFHGPSVMMGYADTAADLARDDELHGRLHTGDLGHLDAEGFLYLDGRIKRLSKVSGLRINLDAVESMALEVGIPAPLATVCVDDDAIVVWYESSQGNESLQAATHQLAARLKLSRHALQARNIDHLPLLPNGKTNYRALEQLSRAGFGAP
jgi:acyl-CoA synthetase (AMP-forming)/AMP-acid ligase II